MTKGTESNPASEVKRRVASRIRTSRYVSGVTLVASAASGVMNGNTIVHSGHGNNTATYTAFAAVVLGLTERLNMYRRTNSAVTTFEQAQYDALPTERVGEVVNLFTKEIVAEAVEVKPAEEPDETPPEQSPITHGYIGTAGPVPALIGGTVAYRTIFEFTDAGASISGGALATTMLGLGGLCLRMGNAALDSHEYECSRRIDAAVAPIPQ